MIEYLKGRLIEKNPVFAVLECSGIGYHVSISVNTYESMGTEELTKLFIHEVIREDSRSLFGFAQASERVLFRHLISVSGVGANTARVILSSYKPSDIHAAIINDNSDLLKSIKGIGAKTALRVIIDLKDKIQKEEPQLEISSLSDNTLKSEALSALLALGFDRNRSTKVLQKVYAKTEEGAGVEQVIKEALKLL
jgi:Holliday junction DNA helicase RuvA|tara:strand:- start:33 stop:617 length:585 start_codon:yes stop_codon:yes gene_type:complete